MKVKVKKDELYKKLLDVQGIVERKSSIPSVNHILFVAESDKTLISATDLETVLKQNIQLEIVSPGSICIPARKLFEIVKEVNGEITLTLEEANRLKVKCGNVKAVLSCLPSSEFPPWPQFNNLLSVEMSPQILKEAIDKTHYAVGDTETKQVLNGLLFHIFPQGRINFVGTDSRRLAVYSSNVMHKIEEEKQLVVSKKAIGELRKFLNPDDNNLIQISIGKNHVYFKIKDIHYLTRLIEGSYPVYEQVIPKDNLIEAMFSKEAILKSLKVVSVMSNEKSSTVTFNFEEGRLSLFSSNPDVGECKDELELYYKGEPMSLLFSARYLIEAIQPISDENVVMKINANNKPVLIQGQNSSDYLSVVMPLRN